MFGEWVPFWSHDSPWTSASVASNSRLQSTAILPQMLAKQQQTGERDND